MPTSSGDVMFSVMVFSLSFVTAGALRPHAFLQTCNNLFSTGARGPLEHFADAWRCFAASDTLHRLIKPVEIATLNFIRQPSAVGRTLRALLHNQHIVGFLYAGADSVPIYTGTIQPAQVYDFGIDRKSVVSGKSVSVRLDLGGRVIYK